MCCFDFENHHKVMKFEKETAKLNPGQPQSFIGNTNFYLRNLKSICKFLLSNLGTNNLMKKRKIYQEVNYV